MTFSPQELREKAELGRKAKAKQAAEKKRVEQLQLAAEKQKAMDEAFPYYRRTIEYNAAEAAKDGLNSTRLPLVTLDDPFRDKQIYGPVWEKLEKYFTDLGFDISITAQGGTEWGSDGAYPDGKLHVEATISWHDD